PASTAETEAAPASAPEPDSTADESATATAAGGGAVQLATGKSGEMDSYLAELTQHLARYYSYPRHAQRLGLEGTATVKFTFGRDGHLVDRTVIDPSGHQRLDQATLDMLRKADPLPAVPDDIKGEKLTLSLPVQYLLQ